MHTYYKTNLGLQHLSFRQQYRQTAFPFVLRWLYHDLLYIHNIDFQYNLTCWLYRYNLQLRWPSGIERPPREL